MRQKIVAGNWKMNTSIASGLELAQAVKTGLEGKSLNDVKLILAPPFTHLHAIEEMIKDSPLGLAAQNTASEKSGAYTGEVSAEMLASAGVGYVILGHSERRKYYHETDELLVQKLTRVLEAGLTPIFCIGEELEDREKGNHFELVKSQLKNGLFHCSPEDFAKVIIAYEPVWAIGTGLTASPEQAEEMHAFIREELSKAFGVEKANACSMLYGGSCKASNARELFAQPNVDGGLIGGASLQADEFIRIAESF